MQRGVHAGKELRQLAKTAGLNQAQLEQATGITHATMSGYWSNRLRLGIGNGRRIASALGVRLEDLGLSEEAEADDHLSDLRRALAALEETVALLTQRVAAIERAPGAPQHAQPARKRKAV